MTFVCSSLITHYSAPHNNVPSAACPAASTLICVVRELLYNVIVALPSLSSIRLGFQLLLSGKTKTYGSKKQHTY